MRKQPQQGRSKELVNIMLQATEKAVCLYGMEGVTTPKVAELAGVSVGSIYQYFADKQSLLEQLMEQKSHEIGQELKKLLSQHTDENLENLIRLTICFGFNILNKNNFYLEVIQHWHHFPKTRATEVMQQYFFDIGQQVLLKHQHDIHLNNLASKLFIIINSITYTMMRYISTQPSLISHDEMIEQLSIMTLSYLQAKPATNSQYYKNDRAKV